MKQQFINDGEEIKLEQAGSDANANSREKREGLKQQNYL
jgi:hypothetical protein